MILALDIGGTKIRIAEVSKTKIKNKIQVETPKTKQEILSALFQLIAFCIENKKPEAICVGIAGMQKNGFVIRTPNMDFNNVNLKKLIQNKFKIKTYVENDARCAALAEQKYGKGRSKKNFVLLTLGTGIGVGIFINNKLYRGNGLASEAGHMLLQISPEPKEFEHLASGKAVQTIGKKFGFSALTNYEIQEMAKKGNKKAIAIYKEIGKNLGIGLLNIVYVLDPEIIILGGGFSNVKLYWPFMLKTLREKDLAKRKIPVVEAKFKDDAGLIGAALLPKLKNQ